MRVGTALAGLLLGFAAVLAPAMLVAQAPAPTPVPAPAPAPAPPATPAISDIVEVTRTVAASATAVAYTPVAGATLVITDIVLTNPNTAPACGIEIRRAGTSVTGALCVPPQTSLQIGLMTGIEFAGGTAVELASGADAGGPVTVHLRGFLVTG